MMVKTKFYFLIGIVFIQGLLYAHNDHISKDSSAIDTLQSNGLFSEFYMDGPWRMPLYNDNNELNTIPVHFFLHDANERLNGYLNVDYIDIQLKSASQTNFNPLLTFEDLSKNDFISLFSSYSETDSYIDIQAFDFNSFDASTSHTLDFNAESGLLTDYVRVDKKYWYFTLNIPSSLLIDYDNVIDIKATIGYSGISLTTDEMAIRVFRSEYNLPKQENYFRGDMHLHSMYTENSAEFGLPLEATKEAAKLIGLDWITTTDHTSDFDNFGPSIEHNWNRIQDEAKLLNSQDSSLIYIAGQEVALNNQANDLVHLLAYPRPESPFDLDFLSDGNGDLISTSTTIEEVSQILKSTEGFSYAAHPFATKDKLPTIPVGGGIWNLGHTGFPSNSAYFPKIGGEIICNEWTTKSDILIQAYDRLIADAIVGAQIWNARTSIKSTGNPLDPWNLLQTSTPFSPNDTADHGHHIKRFRQGQEVVNFVNQLGLKHKNDDSSHLQWKFFYGAGADAHGSFNFSNTDDFLGLGEISDNAVGKLSTLTFCPNGMGPNGENILNALKKGHSSISDGPILNIGLSLDGPNKENEVLMGEDCQLEWNNGVQHFLNINYRNTPEFGKLSYLRLFLGKENGEIAIPWNYFVFNEDENDYSLSLNALMLKLFELEDSNLFERYFYIRAECQTFKEYDSSIHAKSVDYFHAFTNPIWFNIKNSNPSSFESFIYPNPTSDLLYIHLNTSTNQDIMIELFDLSGRIVNEMRLTVSGYKRIDFNQWIQGLSTGQYLIRINNGIQSKLEKLIIKS